MKRAMAKLDHFFDSDTGKPILNNKPNESSGASAETDSSATSSKSSRSVENISFTETSVLL
jgi:hypothetical protein